MREPVSKRVKLGALTVGLTVAFGGVTAPASADDGGEVVCTDIGYVEPMLPAIAAGDVVTVGDIVTGVELGQVLPGSGGWDGAVVAVDRNAWVSGSLAGHSGATGGAAALDNSMSATYQIAPADAGSYIWQVVVASLHPLDSRGEMLTEIQCSQRLRVSPAVFVKTTASITASLGKKTVDASKRGRVRIRVTAPGLVAPVGRLTVKWKGGSKTAYLGPADCGVAWVTLPRLDKGKYAITARFHDWSGKVTGPAASEAVTLKVR